MRKLLILAAVFVLGLAAPSSAATPVLAPEFEQSFPALQPLESTGQEAKPSGALGPDDRVLLAATYWLVIAAFALRRLARRPEHDPTPTVGWVLGYAPPLPR